MSVKAVNPLQSLLYRLLEKCPAETTAALKEELALLKQAGHVGEYDMTLDDEVLASKAEKAAQVMIDRWSIMITGQTFEVARQEANKK